MQVSATGCNIATVLVKTEGWEKQQRTKTLTHRFHLESDEGAIEKPKRLSASASPLGCITAGDLWSTLYANVQAHTSRTSTPTLVIFALPMLVSYALVKEDPGWRPRGAATNAVTS